LPTICDLAGSTAWPKAVEGGSLKPVLLADGTAKVVRSNDYLVFHWPHYQHEKQSTPDSTILGPDGWKLHYWWETDKVQLFRLDRDLGESHDVAREEAERARQLKTSLFDYLSTVKAQLPVKNPEYRPGAKRGATKGDDD
jgi:hypothetical protein